MGPCIDRGVPFQIMSNQLHLPQVDSKLKKHLKDDQWKQDAPELIAKGLNTFVNKVFLFFTFNTFARISKHLFSLCHYGVLISVD